MANDKNNILAVNPNAILLANIRIHWRWIFFAQEQVIEKKLGASRRIWEICEAGGISGSNLNSSCRLTITAYSAGAIAALNSIKQEIIIMINEFFKLKVISDIYVVSSWSR
jgi:hypothetical protein